MKAVENPEALTWAVLGNERLQEFLQTSVASDRCASAYLFTGPQGVGKRTVASHFLQAVLCHTPTRGIACGVCVSCVMWKRGAHPDAVLFDPDTFLTEDDKQSSTGTIVIDRIREILQKLRYRPAFGTYRVALIHHADRMILQASNALLKTLEEPLPNTIIVLTAVSRGSLPLTVRSRCQELAFHSVDDKVIAQKLESLMNDAETTRNIVATAAGRPGVALTFAQNPQIYSAYRELAEKVLDIIEAPLPQRFTMVSALIRPQREERATWLSLQEILGRWRGILLDMVFLCKRAEGYLVNRFAMERMRALADHYGAQHCAESLLRLETARQRLRRNVNPQLIFDDLILHW